MREAPFLKSNLICSMVKITNTNSGIIAGYNRKLSPISPCSNAKKLRCIPQPGQSK